MVSMGKYNALTDVSGLRVGHYTQPEAACGVTVVICPAGAVAAVDVRGAAPGTRETDLLNPINLVEKAQAVVLAGGSVYGLAAADGVVGWLAERGLGFALEKDHVAPIVPSAVLAKAQAQKVAQMAHDGLARAIRPCHTMFDGDAIFCLATGKRPLTQARGLFADVGGQALNAIGQGAADCMARAIIHAILAASSSYGLCAFKDLETR